MTTVSLPQKTTEGAFSYAAAASGKHSPKPTTGSATTQQASQVSTPRVNTPNGITGDSNNTLTATMSPLESKDEVKNKQTTTSSNSSTYEPNAVVNGETPSSTSKPPRSSTEDNQNPVEKQSQIESSSAVKEGSKVPEAGKEKLVPAPPPPVNIWKVRAEEFTAKAKLQPTVVSTAPIASTSAKAQQPKPAEKPVETKQNERKKGSQKQDTGNLDIEKAKDASEHKAGSKDQRDRKKSADGGRANGYPSREDGTTRHGKPKNVTKTPVEKDVVPELPPPLGDATSWPTPETAQDEGKKERERIQREEKEKEKSAVTRPAGPTKFVPAPFTPTIVHNAPLPTKGGRGGRNSRGRGGSSSVPPNETRAERPDKAEKTGGHASTLPEADRERGNNRGGFSGRASYHSGTRGGRRTGSAGGSYPRPPKDVPSTSTTEAKQESEPATQPNTQTNTQTNHSGNDASVSTETQSLAESKSQDIRNPTPPREHDDGTFVGQGVIPPNYSDRQERAHSHSFSTLSGPAYPRLDGSAPLHDQQAGYSQGRQDRGSVSSRGGYRGRGGHYSSQHHNTHVSAHTNNLTNQHYAQQYSSHSQPYRMYNRGNNRAHTAHGRNFPTTYQAPVYPGHQYPIPSYPYYDYTGVMANPEASVKDFSHKEYLPEVNAQIMKQMEYYFSVDNLCKDIYLRKHMDDDGFVDLSLVANFSLIRKLTDNMDILRSVCLICPNIKVVDTPGGCRVRRASGFEAFILRPEERDPSVRDRSTPVPPVSGGTTKSSTPMSAQAPPFQPLLHMQRSLSNITAAVEPLPVTPSQPIVNGTYVISPATNQTNGIQRSSSQLSADAAEFSPLNNFSPPILQRTLTEPTDFPDDKISDVNIIYKKSFLENTTSPEGSSAKLPANGEITSESGSRPTTPGLGHQKCISQDGVSWTIGQSDVSATYKHLHERYSALRTAALQKRLEGSPLSPKMTILYSFWRHFLLKNFNRKMYDEFRSLAVEDAQITSGKSIESLFDFYEAVHVSGSPREEVTKDFVELVQKEGSSAGIASLGNVFKHASLTPVVKGRLDSLITAELRDAL